MKSSFLARMKSSFLARVESRFVELPDPLKAGITAVVLYLVGTVFANLVVLIPFLAFLEPFVPQIAMALALVLIEAIQNLLPSAYPRIAVLAVELVLAVLAAIGIGETLTAMGALPYLLGQ